MYFIVFVKSDASPCFMLINSVCWSQKLPLGPLFKSSKEYLSFPVLMMAYGNGEMPQVL